MTNDGKQYRLLVESLAIFWVIVTERANWSISGLEESVAYRRGAPISGSKK
jgi:hypothetical protein